jgi:hypothetical protein
MMLALAARVWWPWDATSTTAWDYLMDSTG